jgi:hypothetical protein
VPSLAAGKSPPSSEVQHTVAISGNFSSFAFNWHGAFSATLSKKLPARDLMCGSESEASCPPLNSFPCFSTSAPMSPNCRDTMTVSFERGEIEAGSVLAEVSKLPELRLSPVLLTGCCSESPPLAALRSLSLREALVPVQRLAISPDGLAWLGWVPDAMKSLGPSGGR